MSGGFKTITSDGASKKILGFMGVVIVAGAGYVFLSGSDNSSGPEKVSRLNDIPRVSSVDTNAEVGEIYEQALREADRKRIEEAKEAGDSVMPTIIITETQDEDISNAEQVLTLDLNLPEKEEETKLPVIEEPSAPVIEPVVVPTLASKPVPKPTITPQATVNQAQQAVVNQEPIPVGPPPERVVQVVPEVNTALKSRILSKMQALAGAMDNQVGTPGTVYFYQPEQPAAEQSSSENVSGLAASDPSNPFTAEQIAKELQIEGYEDETVIDGDTGEEVATEKLEDYGLKAPLPGHILYARLISQANSDAPAPIIAEIVQGEMAGSRVLGSFTVANEKLILEFNTLVIEKTLSGKEINKSFPITSVAVDTKYIGTGLATKVDRHLFERVAIAFGSTFLGQMGSLMTSQGTTQVTLPDGTTTTSTPTMTIEEIAQSSAMSAVGEAGNIFNEIYGARPTTVIVDSGTPIGLLFLN